MPPICFISNEGKEVYVKNGKTAALFSQVLRDAVSAWSTQYNEEDKYVNYNISSYIVGTETEELLEQSENEKQHEEVESQPEEQIDWNHHHYHYREYDEESEESEEEEEEKEEQTNEHVNTKKEEMEHSQIQVENNDEEMQENVNGSLNDVTSNTINAETESSTVKPNYLIVRKNKHKKRREHFSNNEKESLSAHQTESLEEEEEEHEEIEKEEKTKLAGSNDTKTIKNRFVDERVHEEMLKYIENINNSNNSHANKICSQMHKSRQRHRKGQSCKKMNYKNLQFVTTSSIIANEPLTNYKNVDSDVLVEEQNQVIEENKETSEQEEEHHPENEMSAELGSKVKENVDNAEIKKGENSVHDEEQPDIRANNNVSNSYTSDVTNNESEEEVMLDDNGELESEEEEEDEEEEEEEHDNNIEDEESLEAESDNSDNSCTLEELELMLEEHKENEEKEEDNTSCFVEEETPNDHSDQNHYSSKHGNDEDVQFIKSVLTAPEYSSELPMKLQKLDKSLIEEKLRQRRHSLHEKHSLNSTKIINNNTNNNNVNNFNEENKTSYSFTKDINTIVMQDDDKHKETVWTTTLPSFTNNMNSTNININEPQLFARSHNTINTPSSPLSSNSSSLSSPLSALSTLSSSNSSMPHRRTSASSVKSASVIIKKLDENVADALYDSDNEEIDNNIITENNNDDVNEKSANHFSSSCMNTENNLSNISTMKKNKWGSTAGETRHVDPFDLPEYTNININNIDGEEEMYNSHVTHGLSSPEFNNGKAASENYDKESVEYLSSTPGLTSNMNYSSLGVENNNIHTLNEQKVNGNNVYRNQESADEDDEDDTSMALHVHIDGWNNMNTLNNNYEECPYLSANDQPSHSELDNDDYLNWQSPRSFHQRTPCMIEMEDSPNAVRLLSSDGTEMILRTSYGHEGSVENKEEKQFNLYQDNYVNNTNEDHINNNNNNLESINSYLEEHTEQVDNRDGNNMEEQYNIIITPPKMLTHYEKEEKEEKEVVENIHVKNKENSIAQETKHEEEVHLVIDNVTDLEFCHRRMNESAIVFDFQQSEIHKSCNNTKQKKESEQNEQEEEGKECISEHVCKITPLNEVENKQEQHETDIKHITNTDNVDLKLQKKCLPFSTHVLELCALFLNRLEENRLSLEKSDAMEKWKNIPLNQSHSDDDDDNKNDEEDNEDDDDEESNDSFVNTTVKINNTFNNNINNGLLMNGITSGLSSSTLLMHSTSNTHDNITQRLLTPIPATPLSSPLTAILSEWEIVYLYHDILCYSEHDIANLKWWTTLYPEFDFRCPALSIRMLKAQINKCKITKNNNNKATTNANDMCASITADKNKNDNSDNYINGKVDDKDEGNNINKESNSVSVNCNKSNDILSFAELPIRTPIPPQHGVQTLMTLMKLAQMLQITELYNLCTAWIADHMLRCAYFDDDCFASAQSIRTVFHIENDYTSKERECLAIENEWPADES